MGRTCGRTGEPPASCWCQSHGCEGAERDRRVVLGRAEFTFQGGEALHVFSTAKTGGEVSICNLRKAVTPQELQKMIAKGQTPSMKCEQCKRTLRSKTPNARLKRYVQDHARP